MEGLVIALVILVVGFLGFTKLGNLAADRFGKKAAKGSKRQPAAREFDADHDAQYWTDRNHVGYPLSKD